MSARNARRFEEHESSAKKPDSLFSEPDLRRQRAMFSPWPTAGLWAEWLPHSLRHEVWLSARRTPFWLTVLRSKVSVTPKRLSDVAEESCASEGDLLDVQKWGLSAIPPMSALAPVEDCACSEDDRQMHASACICVHILVNTSDRLVIQTAWMPLKSPQTMHTTSPERRSCSPIYHNLQITLEVEPCTSTPRQSRHNRRFRLQDSNAGRRRQSMPRGLTAWDYRWSSQWVETTVTIRHCSGMPPCCLLQGGRGHCCVSSLPLL